MKSRSTGWNIFLPLFAVMMVLRKAFVSFVLAVLLASCAVNLPQDIPQSFTAPTEYTFPVPFDKAWEGTLAAIGKVYQITTLDRERGLIVTESTPVAGPAAAPQPPLLGWTYTNSYTVYLTETDPSKTTIRIEAKLLPDRSPLNSQEGDVARFAASLRQDLFHKICAVLFSDSVRCTLVFPDYHTVLASCVTANGPVEIGVAENKPEVKPVASTPSKISAKQVRQLQQVLAEKGYDPGPLDAKMGPKTREALRRWQQASGIKESGKLDTPTLKMLGLE